MTGWYLTWILVVRAGFDFSITPNEQPMPSFAICIESKIALERELTENPVVWGDFTSFSTDCKYRTSITHNDPNDYSIPPITEGEL